MTEIRHLTCKTSPVQRKRGGNAVAAAAYRAGENLRDEATHKLHRFAGRQADIEAAQIYSSDANAPDWHYDRAALWSDIEANEKRKDSRTGRDVVLGLAWELTPEERKKAVLEFAQKEFLDRGYVVDIAFHKYGSAVRKGDNIFDSKSGEYISGEAKIDDWKERGFPFLEAHQVQEVDTPHVKIERIKGGDISGYKLYHPHAHVLVSPRAWDAENGAWAKKVDPLFNKPQTAKDWRYDWPKVQNKYLEAAGWDVRVTSTSAEEDAFPETRFLGSSRTNEIHHIEKRAEAMNDVQRTTHDAAKQKRDKSEEFKDVHNEALRRTAQSERAAEQGNDARDAVRTTAWWRNMSARFDGWRADFSEKAEEWQRRFAAQDWRLKSVLGWHHGANIHDPPDPQNPTAQTHEPEP